MRGKKKRIARKPSFIMCLVKALVVSWLITGVLYGGLYVYFDNKCKNIYRTMWQELEDDVCEKTEDLYNKRWTTTKEYNDALMRLKYSISKAAVAGIYTDVHFATGKITWPQDDAYLVFTDKDTGEEKVYGTTPAYDGVLTEALSNLVDRKTADTFMHEAKIRYVNSDPLIGALYSVIYKDRWLLQEDIGITDGTDKIGFICGYINNGSFTFLINKASQLIDGRETDMNYYFGPKFIEGTEFVTANELGSPRIEIYPIPENLGDADSVSKIVRDTNEAYWNWKVGFGLPELPSLASAFPVMVSETLLIAFLIGTVVALIAAIIRYSNAKNVYDLFEYRRKTTDAMAHDLKTPLAAMSGYAENLEENINPDKNPYYISKIRENIDAMNQMVVEILNLSRSEDGIINVDKGKVDIMKLIRESVFEMTEICIQNNVKTDIRGKKIVIVTDARLFKQAVDNLLSNAIKFAETGSTILIEVDDGGLFIRNKFEGEIEDVEKLREPFVKGNAARNAGGNGLGLSIVDNNLNALGHKLILTARENLFEALIKF